MHLGLLKGLFIFTLSTLYQRIRDRIIVWAVKHLVVYAAAEVASRNIAVDLLQYLILT